MLIAIVVLFFVVILMICLHLYARWYLLPARRRQMRSRRQNLVLYVDPANPNPAGVESQGLPAAVLKSLPVFVYSGAAVAAAAAECAVCLS
ncbi:unnamed protein product [Linum trigynum]|uniref:Uncharacterized protein n=1 Tax=Linum trigynum TaxID=586398 RepID=A0AAV2F7P3_9ROSI